MGAPAGGRVPQTGKYTMRGQVEDGSLGRRLDREERERTRKPRKPFAHFVPFRVLRDPTL